MYYVYVLQSCVDSELYVGFTGNLKKRVNEHNSGYVQSTKPRRPFTLIFYEAYIDKFDALRREKYLKTSKGRTTIKTMLREYLQIN